jgi:hypothetical protein
METFAFYICHCSIFNVNCKPRHEDLHQHTYYAKHFSGNCNWSLSWVNMHWSNCIISSLIFSHLCLDPLSDSSCVFSHLQCMCIFFLAGCAMCPNHLFLVYLLRRSTLEMFHYVFLASWTFYVRLIWCWNQILPWLMQDGLR